MLSIEEFNQLTARQQEFMKRAVRHAIEKVYAYKLPHASGCRNPEWAKISEIQYQVRLNIVKANPNIGRFQLIEIENNVLGCLHYFEETRQLKACNSRYHLIFQNV